jgi:hypothetical protein
MSLRSNLFLENLRYGILIQRSSSDILCSIEENKFIRNKDAGLVFEGNCNGGQVAGNLFEGNRVGIHSSYHVSNILVEGNEFRDNSDNAVELHLYSSWFVLRNNTMFDSGIWLDGRHSGRPDIDMSNTLDGRPVLMLENQDSLIVPRGISQLFLFECMHIGLIDDPQGIYSIYMMMCKNVTVKRYEIDGWIDAYNSERIDLFDNRIYGAVRMLYCDATFKNNDLNRRNLWPGLGWDYYVKMGDYDFYRNHYMDHNDRRYDRSYPNYTSDGFNWDQGMKLHAYLPNIYEEEPLVYPFDYQGPRVPIIRNIDSPEDAGTGSNMKFSVNITDHYWVVEAWMEIYVIGNDEEIRVNLTQMSNDTWNATFEAGELPGSLYYDIHAINRAGMENILEGESVIIIDRTEPELTDLTQDSNGTTGDPFVFEAITKDISYIDRVWTELIYSSTGKPIEIEMGWEPAPYKHDRYTAEYTLDEHIIGTVRYRIRSEDHAGNINSTEFKEIRITDNDKPVPFKFQTVYTQVGETLILSGKDSRDNVGIRSHHWYISGRAPTIELSGQDVSYTFHEAAQFLVQYVVTDTSGNSADAYFSLYVKETEGSSDPGGEDLDDDFMTLTIGPVMNRSMVPVKEALVTVILGNQNITSMTDEQGMCYFMISERWIDTLVTIILEKEDYERTEVRSVILPSGRLRGDSLILTQEYKGNDPGGDGIMPSDEIEEEEESSSWVPLMVLIAVSLILVVAGAGSYLLIRRLDRDS